MSKGKKIGGIILVILGTIGLVIGLIIGGIFGVMGSAMDDAMAEVEQQIEDARRTGVSTYGRITSIDSDNMATIEFLCEEDGTWHYMNMMVVSDNYSVDSIVEVCYDPYRLGDSDYVPIAPAMMMEGMDVILSTTSSSGIIIGVVIGIIGLIMLVIGIVMLVSNKKDKKWADEINARNAAMGIGGTPPNGRPVNGLPQGQPNGFPQVQPGQPVNGQGGSSNPYQNNNQNM